MLFSINACSAGARIAGVVPVMGAALLASAEPAAAHIGHIADVAGHNHGIELAAALAAAALAAAIAAARASSASSSSTASKGDDEASSDDADGDDAAGERAAREAT